MLEVHRDWEARTRNGPPDTSRCDAPAIQPFSTRLISAETATNLEAGWEAMGITTQMRHNHAPFTAQRDSNSAEFLRELHRESSTNLSLDPARNLLWEESRAYRGALTDPAMIPYRMHPTKGLVKTGIRVIDSLQWYQNPREKQTVVENNSVSQPSVGISHIMELNEVLRQRFDSLSAWKRDFLSEGGIFLNPRLYNKSQVIQACSRAQEWRDSTRREYGTVDWPATGTDFEDPTIKDLHHMRDNLIEYVESGPYDDIGMEEKLLFRFMCPLSVTSVLEQIKTQQYDLSTGVGDPRNDMTLQFRKQIFITRYMRWLQSLSVRFHSHVESNRALIRSFSKDN
jgi:hypothetical protein